MVLGIIFLIGLLYFKNAPKGNDTPKNQPGFQSQVDEQGGIAFTVIPLELGSGNPVKLEIKIDTHSGSLDFDLMKAAILNDDKGNIYQPQEWQGSPSGGHHRSGILIFPKLERGVKSIRLTVQDGYSGAFEWDLE